jgi:hypothetical protein
MESGQLAPPYPGRAGHPPAAGIPLVGDMALCQICDTLMVSDCHCVPVTASLVNSSVAK